MGGSENDGPPDAPAWLSRAAARYGGLDELVEELGSEHPREHVSERDIDEELETALDDEADGDAAAGGPAEVVADRGVDDVFAEIEAAAPTPDTGAGTSEERSTEDHPVLDTGPHHSFDSMTSGPDREVVEDGVDDLFEGFAESDPAEVAAVAESDGPVDNPDGTGQAGTHDTETAETTGATDTVAATDDDIESVPADLFDDLEAAVGDATTTGDDPSTGTDDTPAHEDETQNEDGDVNVFEWVETASSPMTGGDTATGMPADDGDPFESLAERADPAPTDVLDDAGAETTDVETDTRADTDTPVGAWEYDPDRGLHVDTGEEPADGRPADATVTDTQGDPEGDTTLTDTGTTSSVESERRTDDRDTPDGLVGPEHAPDDLDVSSSGGKAGSEREEPRSRSRAGPTPGTGGDDPTGGASGDAGPDETVLDAAGLESVGVGSDDTAEGTSPDAGVATEPGGDDAETATAPESGRADTPGDGGAGASLGTEPADAVDQATEPPGPPETDPETAAEPDALDGVADGPENDGVIGRVRSFIGRLLP